MPFPDGNERHTYILTSGAAVHVFMAPNVVNALQIHVDVNGTKGPNIIGRDVFALMLYRNGVIDDYANGVTQPPLTEEQRETSYTTWCNSSTVTFWGCFGKLLNDNWEMTY